MKTGINSVRKGLRFQGATILAIMVAGGVLAGCGSDSGKGAKGTSAAPSPGASSAPVNEQINDGKPITLTMFQYAAGITDAEFKNLIADPVNKKWPNVTLQMIRSGKDTSADKLVASNSFPDMMFTNSLSISPLIDLGIMEDISPYIKKSGLDMSQFVPRAIKEIQVYGDKGQMYGLPFSVNYGVTFYNKSIFDKMALDYPKDGITYDDLLQISRKIAGKSPGDIRPLGIDGGFGLLAVNLRLQGYDPKTKKATLETDEWRKSMQMYADLMNVPGNNKGSANQDFENGKEAILTSFGGRMGELEDLENNGKGIDWDMVTFPVGMDPNNQGMETESHMLAISTTSKNKDDDFKIIKYLSSDHQVQEMVSRAARLSSLNDPSLQKVFGSDLKTMKGKHIEAIFNNKFGPMPRNSLEESAAVAAATKEEDNVIAGKEDVNSALRNAQDAATKQIEQLLNK